MTAIKTDYTLADLDPADRAMLDFVAKLTLTPGRMVESKGECLGRTPKSPSLPGTTTMSTDSEKSSFSGDTNSNSTFSSAMFQKPFSRTAKPAPRP